jgi:CheY-like chemotaxis protein
MSEHESPVLVEATGSPIRVLVVEDGEEYIRNLERFLPDRFVLHRAGSGAEALAALQEGPYEVIFLDMRFDRVPAASLLGSIDQVADRFNGDLQRARRFLEDNQGAYVLAAIRDAGCTLPVVFSHDFTDEPRRWNNLAERYAPLDYLPDNAGPEDVSERLASWS